MGLPQLARLCIRKRFGRYRGLRQVGIDLQVQLRRAALDPAQHLMLDRIEADPSSGDRFSDCGQHINGRWTGMNPAGHAGQGSALTLGGNRQ